MSKFQIEARTQGDKYDLMGVTKMMWWDQRLDIASGGYLKEADLYEDC